MCKRYIKIIKVDIIKAVVPEVQKLERKGVSQKFKNLNEKECPKRLKIGGSKNDTGR